MRSLFSFSARLTLPWLLAACLSTAARADGPTTAVRATDFLNSIGANSAISKRSETLAHTIDCARYLGLRWFRSGLEGGLPVQDVLELHKQTGARVSWGLLSGGTDILALTTTARQLAVAGALLAFEGPNEPNNWGLTYKGQTGGKNMTWLPIAQLQSDLFKAVKSDPALKSYPVWGISENGAETDNVGLQFLTIPHGARCAMPDGTHYADYANVHNYIYHPNSREVEDNKTWNASDSNQPATVHDLLLQKSDGTIALAVWSEKVKGTNNVTVNLGAASYRPPTQFSNPCAKSSTIRSVGCRPRNVRL